MAPEPNQEIRLRLSAYLGNILFLLAFLIFIFAISNDALRNMAYRNGAGNGSVYRLLLFGVLFLIFLFKILEIKKAIVIFRNDGNLSIERGFPINKIKLYSIFDLTNVQVRQGLWNRITGDGKLILTFSSPNEKGFVLNKRISLKGLAKWSELKNLGNELYGIIQQRKAASYEQQPEEAIA